MILRTLAFAVLLVTGGTNLLLATEHFTFDRAFEIGWVAASLLAIVAGCTALLLWPEEKP